MKPLNEWTALEALQAVHDRRIRAEAWVRACLDRIDERNPTVHAFVTCNASQALQRARELDQVATSAILHGLPFAAKDVLDSADHVTTHGSPIHARNRPAADAACIACAREQGAVLLGKLATSEFATQTPGAARNPLRLTHTPGGSSSGSAAAVADFMVPVAFGTQTTGSIVRPAAYCGVVGYKPTPGVIPLGGVKALSPCQDTVGVFTRDVQDAALVMTGLNGARSIVAAVDRPRIGVGLSRQWDALRPTTVRALNEAAARLSEAGATVRETLLPAELQDLADAQPQVVAFEARRSLAHERLHHLEELSQRLRARLDLGDQVRLEDYLEWRRRAASAAGTLAQCWGDLDVLLYPAAQGEAEAGLHDSGSPIFGALWTLLQVPTITVPIGVGPTGLPLGIQIIGRHADDLRMLAVAHWAYEVLAPGQPRARADPG